MAQRPIFVPHEQDDPFVAEVPLTFEWFAGFAISQARRSIASLHQAAADRGIRPVLEISSKSADELGVRLSAFHLQLTLPDGRRANVEAAFQGSKVFRNGGPYTDLYSASGRDAKTDERIRGAGDLTAFSFVDQKWPLVPRTAFYDWLYITALQQNPDLGEHVLKFAGFSDIAFNPEKSLNCQARSAALFVALTRRGHLGQALLSQSSFLDALTVKSPMPGSDVPSQRSLL